MVSNFKNNTGYNFDIFHLDGEEGKKYIPFIVENQTYCIVIVDLLSLCPDNKELALRFDTGHHGCLLPICDELDKKLKDFMKEKMKKVFNFFEYKYNSGIKPCYLYGRYLIEVENFKHHLKIIFSEIAPKGKIQGISNDLSNMDFNL